MTHNEMPKDTVEDVENLIEAIIHAETSLSTDDYIHFLRQTLREQRTTAHNKGVEVGRVEERAEIRKDLRFKLKDFYGASSLIEDYFDPATPVDSLTNK